MSFTQDTEVTHCLMRVCLTGNARGIPDSGRWHRPTTCGCYAHVGQHSSCRPYSIVGRSRYGDTGRVRRSSKSTLKGTPYGYRLQFFKNTRGRRPRWEREQLAQINRAPELHDPVGLSESRMIT